MHPDVIDATEDFDIATETGIVMGDITKKDMLRIADRIAKRHKVEYEWDDDIESVRFYVNQ